MAHDHGLQTIEQGSAPHPCACAQHCHHLRYLGHGPRNVSCCTGLRTFFFHYTHGHWITRLICFNVRETTMDISSASSRPPAWLQNMSWDSNPRSVPVLLFHINQMGPLHWWHNVNMWRLTSPVGHSANFAGTSSRERMNSKSTENSRPRDHHNVLGKHLVRQDVRCPQNCDW